MLSVLRHAAQATLGLVTLAVIGVVFATFVIAWREAGFIAALAVTGIQAVVIFLLLGVVGFFFLRRR